MEEMVWLKKCKTCGKDINEFFNFGNQCVECEEKEDCDDLEV